jgi:capsule polysaccharide export protein KpsE/RkpR
MEKPHDMCSYTSRIDDVIAGMLASLVVYGKFKLCLVQIGSIRTEH